MKKIVLIFIGLLLFSCNNNEKRNNKQEYKIGVILPLSGSGAAYGKDALRGIKLAIEELNKGNVIYSLIIEDSQTNPKMAVSGAQKLIFTDKVKVIIGPVTSSCTLAVSPICEKEKVVCLSPGASNPKISAAGDYIFRNWISDELEGKAMANYIINDDKIKNICVLYINNDYGVGLRNVFEKEIRKLGGNIVLDIGYEQNQTDFKTIIGKIKKSNTKVIYMPGYYKEMANILIESKKNNLNIPFRSVVTFEEPKIFEIAGNLTNNVIYSSPYYQKDNNNKTFFYNFEKKYNRNPGIFAAHAYDAMMLIVNCYNNISISTDKIKECLYHTKRYNGVSGITSFDKNGDVIKPVAIKKTENNLFKLIKVINYEQRIN